jgi:hypothetical protein
MAMTRRRTLAGHCYKIAAFEVRNSISLPERVLRRLGARPIRRLELMPKPIHASKPYPCKGAGGQVCPQTVIYAWTPMYTLSVADSAKKVADNEEQTAYLTCTLGHTNPYTIDESGEIIG